MDDRIAKVLDHIENNLSSNLSLQELADVACMSTAYFHRKFKAETGKTPFRFREEIKMNYAMQQLISGRFKVHEMSSRLGYQDYETFNRAFKKHFQLAPDDLKAIAKRVMKMANVDERSLIIKPMELESEDELEALLDADELKKILWERGYSEEDLKDAQILTVRPKESEDDQERLVKNKFYVMEGQKIWRTLLAKIQNGTD